LLWFALSRRAEWNRRILVDPSTKSNLPDHYISNQTISSERRSLHPQEVCRDIQNIRLLVRGTQQFDTNSIHFPGLHRRTTAIIYTLNL
jgi:hypothetical protein